MLFNKEPIVVSDDNPLIVSDLDIFRPSKLIVYRNKLKFNEIRCNFFDIEHIGWHWESKTINFINKQKACLSLYIRGYKNPICLCKTTMYLAPKIVIIYNYLAKETFQNRLSFYTKQLEKSGGFIFDNCYFYSDGKVVINKNTYKLSDGVIEPFGITFNQGGLFSSSITVNLSIDRDVILTLIDFILKNPQNPAVYINDFNHQKETQRSRELFLRDIVSLMAMLSSADGYVSPEEVAIVKIFLTETMGLEKSQLPEVIGIFNEAKISSKSFDFFAKNLFNGFKSDRKMLSAILDLLFSIAIADGILSVDEELLLLEAETIFGIHGDSYSYFNEQKNEAKSTNAEYYYNILGLSSNATKKEIKHSYRRLVMKFHPDKVEHLGEDFVREAVTKMKEINEAYEYLQTINKVAGAV